MKYYLNFYKENENFMVKADEFDNHVKTNFEEFNALIFVEEKIEHNKITDYKLIIEKEENGNYNYMSSFEGNYNYNDGTVEFNKCNFKKSLSNNANFIIYIELYEGGIRVYNGKDKHIKVILRKECSDFKLDILEAKNILDVFEIENELINELNVKIISQEDSKFNTFMYYLEINKNESVAPGNYIPFGNKEIDLVEPLEPEMFMNNETYIHVFLKDSFNNVKYKKFHLVTKNSKFTCFEIKDEIKKIRNLNENISIFFEERTVESLTPVIQIDQNTQIVSEKQIGLLDKRNGYFNMVLTEYFPLLEEVSNCQLFFLINDSEILSNALYIDIDSVEPKMFFNNLDEDNYQLIKEDIESINLTGVIEDKNYFYIGSSSLKCDFENIGYNYIVKGNNFDRVTVNGVECIYIKGENYSYVVSDTFGQLNFILNGEPINLESINDSNENGKAVYVVFNKNELSTYENNIIKTQGNLKLKNSKIIKQEFFEICDRYIIKAIFPTGTVTEEEIDIGIDNFEYSFLRKLERKNVSCELTGDKKFIFDYVDSKFVFISKFDEDIIKYNSNKILSKRKGFHLEGLTFFPISLKADEFFTTVNNVVYIDNKYNQKNKADVYGKINLTLNNELWTIDNILMEKVNENSYLFSFYTKIGEGINNFTATVYDENGNFNQNSFVIEKTNRQIELELEKENKNYNLLKKDSYQELTTNKDEFTLKIFVKNETYKQKNQDNYIGVDNGSYEKRYKIFNDRNSRVALIELEGEFDEKKYQIYYINGENKDVIKTVKKDFIKVYTEDDVITGLNEYYLYIEKDDFVKIKAESSNDNIKLEYEEEENRLKITRVNNDKVIERDIIKIFAYDDNGIYQPYKKEVNIEMYNDNVIYNFQVDENFLIDEKIYNPSFNINFNILYEDEIKEVYYYDKAELDIFKRKKKSVFLNGKYVIENIVTPMEKEEMYLYIIFNNGVEIRKEIFKDKEVILSFIEANYKVGYKKDLDSVTFKIKNDFDLLQKTNIKIKYENETLITPCVFSPYETIEIKIDNLSGKTNCLFEIYYEKNNKNYFIDYKIIDFKREDIIFEIENLPVISLYSLLEDKVFNVNTKEDINKIKIRTISDKKIEKEFKIINNKVNFNFNDNGVYEIYVYYEDKNIKKLIKNYIMQVFIDKQEYIDFNIDNFKKFSFISSIVIKNKSILETEDLLACIEYQFNNQVKKNLFPKVQGDTMMFILPKEIGKNEYYYKDKKGSLKLAEVKITELVDNSKFTLEIQDDKNEIFSKKEDSYIFEKATNVTIDIKNLNRLEVYSYKTRRNSVQYLGTKKETKINGILMPCKISAYDNNNLKVKEIELLLNEVTTEKYKLTKNKSEKISIKLKINENEPLRLKDALNCKIVHYKKHRMYHYFIGFALKNGLYDWLNLSETERHCILTALDEKAYDKRSIEKTNENLKELFLKFFNGGNI